MSLLFLPIRFMWYFILLLTLIIAYFAKALFLLPFLLIAVIAVSSFETINKTALFSFLAGLLADVGSGTILGQQAVFFLLVSLLIKLYQRRFRQESAPFIFIFTFLMVHLYYWLFVKTSYFLLLEGLLSGVLVIFFTGFLYSVKQKVIK